MRLLTIPLLGALALSLIIADPATARPRFGPGAFLGAFAGMFGGFRHGHRSHRHANRARAYAHASARARRRGTIERIENPQIGRIESPQDVGTPKWAGPVFWPHAADDLLGYALFPDSAGARFWAYGDVFNDLFVDGGSVAAERGRANAGRKMRSASATTEGAAEPLMDLCGSAGGPGAVDAVIERLTNAVTPDDTQRALLARLKTAVAAASERIAAVCPTEVAGNPMQRLDTMQDRIGALRDAALTVRVPLENFYDALSDEQKTRLDGRSDQGAATQTAREPSSANCRGQRAVPVDSGALERLINPTPEQRAGLQALQMQLAGLGQLVLRSCPAETPASPVERLEAAGDRLTTLLFAVMNAGPALQAFYGSLSDEQKTNISNSIRRRAGERA